MDIVRAILMLTGFFLPALFYSCTAVSVTNVKLNRPLEGVTVRCCAVVYDPFVYPDNTRKSVGQPPFDGLSIAALTALQDITGFSCSSFVQYKPFGTENFNEFVSMLGNCTDAQGIVRESSECACDMGISGWWENPSRIAVEFLPEHAFDSMNVVTHVDNTSRSLSGAFFLYNFSLHVWIAIAGLVIAFVILHVIDHRFETPYQAQPDSQQNDSPQISTTLQHLIDCIPKNAMVIRTLFSARVTGVLCLPLQCNHFSIPDHSRHPPLACSWSVGKMLRYSYAGDGSEDRSVHQWILSIIIVLCGLFLALAYEASMTALLVVDNPSSKFRTIQDIKECKIPDTDFCISAGDGVDFYWNATIRPQPCRDGKDTGPIRLSNYEEVLEHVANKKCKYLLADDGLLISSIKKKYCGVLTKTGETLFTKGVSFVVPYGWKYNPELRKGSVMMHELRLIPTLEEYNEEYVSCDHSALPQLDFQKLRVFFFIAYATCAILLVDIVIVNRRRKQNARQ